MIINNNITVSVSGASTISSDPIVAYHTYTTPFTHTGHLVKGTTITISTTTAESNIQCYIILGSKTELTQVKNLGQVDGKW